MFNQSPNGTPYVINCDANGLPIGSGSTGGLSDTILTDDSGTQFLARDTGLAITYVTLAGVSYTPTGTIKALFLTGGATSANQTTTNNTLATISANTPAVNPADGGSPTHVNNFPSTQPVTGAFYQATQPVSLASVTANAGTNLNTSALAIETGGNLTSIAGTNTTMAVRGQQISAQSTSVVLSSDGPFSTSIGSATDTVATSDTGTFSLLAFIKRGLQNWTALLAKVPTQNADGGMPVHVNNVFTPTGSSGSGTTSSTVNTSTTALAANPTRQFLLFTNAGTAGTIYVNISGQTASITSGIPIQASGSLILDSKVTSSAITVFSATASVPYYIVEG